MKCCICGKTSDSYPLWSVIPGKQNVVCAECIRKAHIYRDLERSLEQVKSWAKEYLTHTYQDTTSSLPWYEIEIEEGNELRKILGLPEHECEED